MPLWCELLVLLVVAALLTALVKAFLVESFMIPSGSMENTLQPGERVLVNRLIYDFRGINRGDVVVFSGTGSWDPPPRGRPAGVMSAAYHDALDLMGVESTGTDYVKRVIGLPGDHVACCDRRGRITVNGTPLDEKAYLYPGDRPSTESFQITVPPGRLWVMGDHRGDSADSRYHPENPGHGTVPESAVVGRAFLVAWPPSDIRSIPIPAAFSRLALAGSDPAGGLGVAGAPAGMLPLAWVCRRLRGRRPAKRR